MMRFSPERSLRGKKVGIFGKGGSGKSTVTVLLARAFRRAGYEVAVLDADSTNAGLPEALGLEASPEPLIEHFGGMVFSGGSVTCPVDDPTPLEAPDIFLDSPPEGQARKSPDGIWLLVAGKMGQRGPGAGCDGPIAKIVRDVRIHDRGEEPVTLVDFKAGFEDTARGVIIGLDWALVVVDPTLAAVQMAIDLKDTVEELKRGALPATEHLSRPALIGLARDLYRRARIEGVFHLLNKVSDAATERVLRTKLGKEGIDPIGVMPTIPSIAASWLEGAPLDSITAELVLLDVVRRIETAESTRSRQAPGAVRAG
jgi:CO dehydrogenase nickel-insertion accessory protein CooC1